MPSTDLRAGKKEYEIRQEKKIVIPPAAAKKRDAMIEIKQKVAHRDFIHPERGTRESPFSE